MKKFHAALVLLVVGFGIYLNSLFNPFIWDDLVLIGDNPFIKNFHNTFKVFISSFFPLSYDNGNYYRPVHSLTNMFDYSLWGLNPIGYHLTNIILHIICAFLLYLFVLKLTKKESASLAASILFLVNPVYTEAVTYISGRAESLVAIFVFLSILLHNKYYESSKNSWLILTAISFTFALLSKELAIITPFLIIIYDYYFFSGKYRKTKPTLYKCLFIILAIYIALRLSVLNFASGTSLRLPNEFILRLMATVKSILFYPVLLAFPLNLHMERTIELGKSLWSAESFVCLVVFVSLVILAIKSNKKHKLIIFGLVWFLITILPVMSIFIPTRKVFLAEHWLYLPSTGLFLIAGLVFENLFSRFRKITLVIMLAAVVFYSYLTVIQNLSWQNSAQFYKRIIRFAPDSAKAHFNLGLIYEQQNKFDDALLEYENSLKIEPGYFLVYNNIGNIYAKKGDYDSALRQYLECIKNKPDYFLSYNNLGNLYSFQKEYTNAIAVYNKAIEFNPYYSESYNNLGLVYMGTEEYVEANKYFLKAISLNPDNAEAYGNLGILYFKEKKFDLALVQYKKAISLKPDFDKAHFNLGVLYLQDNQIVEAKKEWKKVLSINPGHKGALENLQYFERSR